MGKRWSLFLHEICGGKAPGSGGAPPQAVATGAGIGALDMALVCVPGRGMGHFNVLARTGAGVGQVAVHKLVQRLLVQGAPV